jgi:hypothetical protein
MAYQKAFNCLLRGLKATGTNQAKTTGPSSPLPPLVSRIDVFCSNIAGCPSRGSFLSIRGGEPLLPGERNGEEVTLALAPSLLQVG